MRLRRVAGLFLMRFHEHNIVVVGSSSFLRVVRIAHDGNAVDHRRLFSKGLFVILVDVTGLFDPDTEFLWPALNHHHFDEIRICIVDNRPNGSLGFPHVIDGSNRNISKQSLTRLVLELLAETDLIRVIFKGT